VQDGQGQRATILEYAAKNGLRVDEWIAETISSRVARADRVISKVIEQLGLGDTMVVSELSRHGRSSITEVGAIIESIRERGASLVVVGENMTITAGEMDIKTQAVLSALMLAGRIERDMIGERTRNALQARRAAGVKLGRPTGTTKLKGRESEIKKYRDLGLTKSAICKLVGCSRGTLDTYLIRNERG
jgi:DNA invertase Pin-like site-specific DNA recombinase